MSPPVRGMLSNMWPRSPDGPVFTYNERPIKSVRRTFQRACKKAGLDDVVFQTTRHSFASWFMMNGGGLFRLQKYLGHSTSALTQRYAHLSRDHRQDGVRSFSAPKSTADNVVPFAGAQASGPPHLKG